MPTKPAKSIKSASQVFSRKFLDTQRQLLLEERGRLVGAADRLEAEADALLEDQDGDVRFDEEGGEGDTMVVERGRDLMLSAQARDLVSAIDAALARLDAGTYGYSVISNAPLPVERLEALPWAAELVTERAGTLLR